jgi:rod shape determining protein RodA
MHRSSAQDLRTTELSLVEKFWRINWGFVFLLCAVSTIGFAMLYSAANGNLEPWASRQMIRFALGVGLLVTVALIDIRFWLRYAYVAYFLVLALLIAVEVGGLIGMGAQRWIDLGVVRLQPSELMKVVLVLALARYFHGTNYEEIGSPRFLVIPALLILAPVALVARQPDLGTAVILLAGGGAVFFLAGVRIWQFALVAGAGIALIPFGWQFLHDYQKQRVLTFFNPENDPLGAGYHILQSKIALGSGGMFGKGFLQGTQSHLQFLPEKQTDFIFTMITEEFGMFGGLGLLALYALILAYGIGMSLNSRNQFGRLLGLGVTSAFFLYVVTNVAMVTGMIPVVGIPLPLISYGGTAMLTLMFGFGLLMSVYVHRDLRIGRRGGWIDT